MILNFSLSYFCALVKIVIFVKILLYLFNIITTAMAQNFHIWLTTSLCGVEEFSTLTIEYYHLVVLHEYMALS